MKEEVPMQLNDQEECFTHKHDDGTLRTFPTGFMFRFACEQAGRCSQILCAEIKLEQRVADHILANMGIEQPRLDRLAEPYLYMPLIGILWGESGSDGMCIVDGNHRYLKLMQLGIPTARVFVFKRSLWEQMLIPLPDQENRLTAPSGVIEHERKNRA